MRSVRPAKASCNRDHALRGWLAIAVAVSAGCFALTGCADSLRPAADPPAAVVAEPPAPFSEAIGVLREGWHTGIVLPVAEIRPPLSDLHHWFPCAKYLAFGWGERNFYMAAHRHVGTALAALLPSESVLLVQALPASPQRALAQDASLRWIRASPREVAKLDAYLGHYLPPGPDGWPVSLERGSFAHSRFFASTGTYDAFHTCNTWTLAGLAYAGLPVDAEGAVFSDQVTNRISELPTRPLPTAGAAATWTRQDETAPHVAASRQRT